MLKRTLLFVYVALLVTAPFTAPASIPARIPVALQPTPVLATGGYQVTFLPMMRFDSTSSKQVYKTAMTMRTYRADTSKMIQIPGNWQDTLLALRIAFSSDSAVYTVTVRFYTIPGIVDTVMTIAHNSLGSTYNALYANLGYLRPTGATWMDIIVTPKVGTPVPHGPYGTDPEFYYPAIITRKV